MLDVQTAENQQLRSNGDLQSLKRRLPQFRTTDVHLYHDDNIGKSVMFVEFNKESV